MSETGSSPLIEAAALSASRGDPATRVVDASWYLPISDDDAQRDYEAAHIPGAVRIDIEELSDHGHAAPHMLPRAELFARAVGEMGIGDDHNIVVYDRGEYAAARVWWMFRVFGHHRVALLDGGLDAWKNGGYPLEAGVKRVTRAVFTARRDDALVRTMSEMRENLDGAAEQVVDARPPRRFAGELPEMRAGVESGHIPGSVNLHYVRLLDPASGKFRPTPDIEDAFRAAGVDVDRPLVATCGSGVSACSLALGLYLTGRESVPVYDGSWAEWGAHAENPRLLGSE